MFICLTHFKDKEVATLLNLHITDCHCKVNGKNNLSFIYSIREFELKDFLVSETFMYVITGGVFSVLSLIRICWALHFCYWWGLGVGRRGWPGDRKYSPYRKESVGLQVWKKILWFHMVTFQNKNLTNH